MGVGGGSYACIQFQQMSAPDYLYDLATARAIWGKKKKKSCLFGTLLLKTLPPPRKVKHFLQNRIAPGGKECQVWRRTGYIAYMNNKLYLRRTTLPYKVH